MARTEAGKKITQVVKDAERVMVDAKKMVALITTDVEGLIAALEELKKIGRKDDSGNE